MYVLLFLKPNKGLRSYKTLSIQLLLLPPATVVLWEASLDLQQNVLTSEERKWRPAMYSPRERWGKPSYRWWLSIFFRAGVRSYLDVGSFIRSPPELIRTHQNQETWSSGCFPVWKLKIALNETPTYLSKTPSWITYTENESSSLGSESHWRRPHKVSNYF